MNPEKKVEKTELKEEWTLPEESFKSKVFVEDLHPIDDSFVVLLVRKDTTESKPILTQLRLSIEGAISLCDKLAEAISSRREE